MNQVMVLVSAVVLILVLVSPGSMSESQSNQLGKGSTCNYCHLIETLSTQMNTLRDKLSDTDITTNPCVGIKRLLPDSQSGNYNATINGRKRSVYCNMDELCGNSGGWVRVGHLNMTDSSETCPTGFQTYDAVRACGRPTDTEFGCISVNFTTYGVSYTQVCGRVTGYQKGAPDSFSDTHNHNEQRGDINLAYVDGVSITRGSGPRKHIWTYAASPRESPHGRCPCDVGSTLTTPLFVGDDYFCETARESTIDYTTLYTDDLLWDGEQCGSIQEPCCEASRNMPWFKKVLDDPSTDFIELRVCGDESQSNEDVGVNYYDIYVK